MKSFREKYNSFRSVYESFASKAARSTGSRADIEGPIDPQVLQDVTDSINNRWNMSITYTGETGLKKVIAGSYSITPMIHGLNKFTKNHILRAYVHTGGTFEGWVTFRLDRIKSSTPFKTKSFDKAPPGFRPGADDLMSEIITIVKFPEK